MADERVSIEIDTGGGEQKLQNLAKSADQVSNAFDKTSPPTQRFTKAQDEAAKAAKNTSLRIQNASYQIADFAVQVESGQSVTRALGQQLPQLLGPFGTLGAILGTLVAVGLPALVYLFNKLGGDTRNLKEKLTDLNESLERFSRSAQANNQTLQELRNKYGDLSTAARDYYKTQKDLEKAATLGQLAGVIDEIASKIANLNIAALDTSGAFVTATDPLGWSTLNEEIAEADVKVKLLYDSLGKLNKASKPSEILAATTALQKGLTDALNKGKITFEEYNTLREKYVVGLQKAADASLELERNINANLAGQREALNGQVAALQLRNKLSEEARGVQTQILGLNTETAAAIQQSLSAQQNYEQQILDINTKISVERARGGKLSAETIANLETQKKLLADALSITQAGIGAEYTRKEQIKEQALEAIRLREESIRLIEILNAQAEIGTKIAIARGASADQANRDLEITKIELANKQRLLALEQELQKARVSSGPNSPEVVDVENRIKAEKEFGEKKIALAKRNQEQTIAIQESSVAGAQAAFDQLARASTPFMIAQNQIQAVFNGMDHALDKFVETGKFKFSDFARSVIADLLKIQLKASAVKLFQAAGGASGIAKIFGFADGGQPPVNQPSIVGERGPELFVPRSAGTIVPNDKLGMGGGQTITNVTNVYNNISALDAKSVAQLFNENRKTLLGVTEQARKEMPIRQRF